MAAIDFGSGANTATGDTVSQALVKLQARIDAFGTPAPTPTPTGFYLNGSSNTAWKAAKTRVVGGTGRGKIVYAGDSLTAGQGAGNTGPNYLDGARSGRPSFVMAGLMRADGVPAWDLTVVGDNGAHQGSVTLAQYDPRSVVGSDWYMDGDVREAPSLGLFHSGAAVGSFDFTGKDVDRVEVGFLQYANNIGYFASTLGAVSPTPKTFTATSANVRHTLTVPRGSQTFQIASQSSQLAWITIRPYDSTEHAFDIVNYGACGARTADAIHTDIYGADPWGNLTWLVEEDADLYVIKLTTNDQATGVSAAAAVANLNTMIDALPSAATVLLIVPHSIGPVNDSIASQYNTAIKAMAASRGIALFSHYEHYGLFDSTFAAQMRDDVHPKRPLYADMATKEWQCLQAMAV